MIDLYLFILVMVLIVLVSVGLTIYVFNKTIKKKIAETTHSKIRDEVELKLDKEYKIQFQNKFTQGVEKGKQDAILQFKQSVEYKALLENEKLQSNENGKNEGIKSYKNSLEYEAILSNEYYRGRKEGIKEAQDEYFNSPEFAAIKENEYRKGKEAGAKEELDKFRMVLNPVSRKLEGFFSKKSKVGYSLQLYYGTFAVGDQSVRYTQEVKESKDENIKLVGEIALRAMETYINTLSGVGIATSIGSKDVKDVTGRNDGNKGVLTS